MWEPGALSEANFYAEETECVSEDPAAWWSLSLDLRFISFLTSSSFLSTKCIRSLKLSRRLGFGFVGCTWETAASRGLPAATELEYLLYCQIIFTKNTPREKRQIIAHSRKRPQKLPRSSLLGPNPLSSELQLGRVNHSSWILWSWPVSESWSMAVDMSPARGESLWNACKEQEEMSRLIYFLY